MDVSKSDNLTLLSQENNVQEMLNNEIQNNEILSLSEDNTTLSASNTDNDTLSLSNTDNNVLGDAGDRTALSTLISHADPGSVVCLPNDYKFTTGYSSTAGISINKNLTIDGQGYTIDANELGRIFNINTINCNVTLKNIIFKNANYGGGVGGAIYFKGSSLTVENCTFESNKNHFSKGGGAIYCAFNENVLINITNSTFTKNTVEANGGALYFDNPSEKITTYNVYITNCDFNENYAGGSSGYGGGAMTIYRLINVYIDSSRFVANGAGPEGGAIRYSGSTTIRNSEFYSNTANHGAAICTGQPVDLNIYDSIFANNTAISEGGAIKARVFDIDGVKFINNTADKGGAIFARLATESLKNSYFFNNTAVHDGGALFVHNNVTSLSMYNNKFIKNNATLGGAIYSEGNVENILANLTSNTADNGGAIYINRGKFTLSESNLENNTATMEGGAVNVRADDIVIKNSQLNGNSAPLGGAIYWYGNNGKVSESTFVSNRATNGTSINWRGNSGTIEKSSFNDKNITRGSVFWHGTGGTISQSEFLTPKAVYVCDHGEVSFNRNTELSPESRNYIVYVGKKASFDSNNFNNLIYNYGLITSSTYMVTLDNTTKLSNSNSVVVYTTILDDNNNTIRVSDNIVNVHDSNNLPTTYNGTHYESTINGLKIGEHRFSATGYNPTRFGNLTVQTGGILYLVLNLTVNQTNYGEKVVITTTIVNTTYNGTIDIALNDIHYNVTLSNGTAVLTLYNLAPNTYDITATYMELNQTISTDIEIKVELRNSTINITANNVYYGNTTTINVNVTNGTTGNVYLFVNNKMYIVKLVNSTAQLNLTNLAGGNYTVYAFYNGDVLFDSSYNNTTFTVYKYKPQINITVKDIYVGEIATIEVDLPNDAMGKLYVDIGDKEYVYTNKTSVTIYESNLTAGNVSVRAYYLGNDKYYESNTTAYFNVTKKNMTMRIETADIPMGENATISVIVPSDAKGIVLLSVNGTNYFEYANATVAKFIISGLERGVYNVTAVYDETPIYNKANVSSSFKVNYVYSYDFNVTATSDSNLTVYVNISLPKDIDGDVFVEINGTNYTAHMSKGKDIVVIPGLTGGEYNGTVYLVNDSKYHSSNRTFTVDLIKITPNIRVNYNHTIFVDDDAIIRVKINDDATGNITISINNTNYTEKIKNGESVFNITGLVWHTYQFNVTYDGDRKYLPDKREHTLEVSRIHNYYSNLEVHDIFVGENATIKVTFENDTTGRVKLLINGSTYFIDLINGTGSINVSGLPVGKHIINATYLGDNKYEPINRIFEDFHVKKIMDYPFTPSGVTNDTHANITVTLPVDADGYVNITINGITYSNVEVRSGRANLTVGGLESGKKYPTKIDYSGNAKYEPASRNITLNSQKTLDYEFTVQGDSIYVGDVAHIIVKIPKSVDGDHVVIRVQGRADPYNMFIQNHTVNCSVINLKEGEYSVTVEYGGNDELESSVKSTHIYVSKISSFKFDVVTNEPYVGENLTVDIQLPTDSTGKVNVTVSINNTNYTANVTNGSARVIIPNLPAGVYNATVYYSGDDKYHSAVKTVEVVVEKIDNYEFTVTPVNIYVGQNETIKIQLPKDINGTVRIRIFNSTYVDRIVDVVNGTGWFNVSDLAIGDYVVYASLKNDGKYEDDTVYSNFKVSPIDDYLFNVVVSDPNYVRDNVTFTVSLPDNATGNVTLTVFTKNYYGVVKDGVAVINVTAKEYGTFPYKVTFEEKGKYALKSQTGSVVISKINVDLIPEFKSPVVVDENITFKVQLPKDATGTITVITRMKTYTETLINGSANITVPGYPLAQNYSPSISYSGDDRYNANTTSLNVVVNKVSDYKLTVNVSDINVGQIEVVNITLPADATDDVLIYGNFSTRTYSQSINKGNVTFNIADLPAGTYNITVVYQGYNKYESKNVTKIFRVSKVNSTIAIELVNRTIIVTVPGDATGNVSINISNIKANVPIDKGKAILDVSNLLPGEYLVNASYAGDGKYLGNKTSRTITLPKVTDYLINVTVEDIIVGENATVIVHLPSDANGFANITVNNTPHLNVEVKTGIARLNVTGLAVGNYIVYVNYTDNKYAFNTNKTKFNVHKIKTSLFLSVDVENQTANITVTITKNATGNITVYVDNKPYNLEIKDNKVNLTLELMPGDHIVEANYDGDTNHTDARTPINIIDIDLISDYDLLIDLTELITVVENNNITVTLPEKAHGTITIYVNDDFYDVEINTTTHKATLTLPYLKEGNYTVYVSYADEWYAFKDNSSDFKVIKLNTTIDVQTVNITKDLSEIINITLHENATGDVLINVSGTVYHETLENGKASIPLSNLNDGNYTVIVIYEGDDFFNSNLTSINFTVSKIPVNITVNASDIIVGHVLTVKFNMSREITDLVTVQVGDENHTTFVYKGIGSLDVHDLPVGDYNVIVYYLGNDDYLSASNRTKITVTGKKSSQMNVSVADITVGENITVYVNTTKGINGPVYVTIAGRAYTGELVDGKANITVSNLTARAYTVSAFFMGNDDYDLCNATSNFTVHKKNTNIALEVSDIKIGEYEIVNVTVNKNATGYVSISIGDLDIRANITEGRASAVIRNLAVGKYNVTVTYMGDDNFNVNSTNNSFTVSQLKTNITIKGSNIYVGQNVTFNITTSAKFTEVVIVNIASETDPVGKNRTTFVENGNGTLTVYDLPVGNYKVTVFFPGNTRYEAVNNTTTIKVNGKKTSQVTVKVSNITVGENATVYVNVTDGATGTVALVIAGDTYIKDLSGSKVNFTIPGLIARDYHVTAYYLGDTYYDLSNSTANFTVNKKNTSINVDVKDTVVGNLTIIFVNVTDGATGDVLINVNGSKYYSDLINSKTNITIPDLRVGSYNVTVIYRGDDNYHSNETNTSFKVSKLNPEIIILLPDGHEYAYGDAVIIHLTGPKDVTGVVLVKVTTSQGYDEHTAYINNGAGTLTIIKPNVGSYNVSAVYQENYMYYSSKSNNLTFSVYMSADGSIDVITSDINAGNDENITVILNGNHTGMVTIVVNGTEYNRPMNYDSKNNQSIAVLQLPTPDVGVYNVKAVFTEKNGTKTVIYEGTSVFSVSKIASNIKIAPIDDIKVGENVTITVTGFPADVNATIDIYVGGKHYTVNSTNPTLVVSDLGEGVIAVRAVYNENSKYLSSQDEANFTVSKNTIKLTLDVGGDVGVGYSKTITVKLNVSDATGNVIIKVNGISYLAPIKGNVATLTLNNLTGGIYSVQALYDGNGKYLANKSGVKSFNVKKLSSTTSVEDVSIIAGDIAQITVIVSEGATGTVNVTVNGTSYNVGLVNSKAVVYVNGLTRGKYDIKAVYNGDDRYYGSSNMTAKVNVTVAEDFDMYVVASNTTVGGQSVVEIFLPGDAQGTVTIAGITENVVNGRATIALPKETSVGGKTVNVVYNGDNTKYATKSADATYNVVEYGDDRLPSSISIDVKEIYYVDDSIVIGLTTENTSYVNLTINGKSYTVKNNKVTIPKGLASGSYFVNAIFDGDEKYLPSQANATFTVNKVTPTNVVSKNLTFIVGNEGILEISGPNDRTANLIVRVDGINYAVELYNGKATLNVSKLSVGKYDIDVVYIENDKYVAGQFANVSTVIVKNKDKIDVNLTIDAENKTVTIELPEDATGNVTVIIDGKVYNITDAGDSPIVIDISDVPPGNHTIEVIYSGDDKYANASSTQDISIPKDDDYPFDLNVDVDGDKATITVDLPEDVNGPVLIDVDGKGYYINVKNGKGSLEITDLTPGKHTVVANYPGNDKYAPIDNTTTFETSGTHTPIDIDVDDIEVGEDLVVVVNVPKDAKGDITIKVDGKTYTEPVNKGKAEFVISNLGEGNYTIEATYPGDDKYSSNSTKANVKVSKVKDYSIDVTVDGKDITVQLPEDAEGNVTVIVDGKEFTGKVENGTVTINDPNLTPGKHNITVIYGDEKYAPEKNSSIIDVQNKLYVRAPEVIKYYSGPERFYVYVEDLNGPIANASLSITINGVTYSRTTNKDGIASLPINLHSGEFKVTVNYKGSDEFDPLTIYSNATVKPTIYAKDLTKVFRNGTHYYALFLDGTGKPLKNTDVTFNIHGVFYTRTTNATGWAKLNINIERGEYIITAYNTVTGEMKSNTIKVISQIVDNYDVVKYYRNATQFTARILADDGNSVGAGEAVTFNIHGVIYTRYTNATGHVNLTINLEPGEYIMTTYYKQCREGNIIKVLPVLTASDLNMNYRDGSSFVAHVVDGHGNPNPNKMVDFNINGVIYHRLTDNNGDAKLGINLQRGEYIITSSYESARISNKITIS